jgi:hypothetical protein
VISVTPRVLRAPNVTPRDEEMRPSGTLQSPTTGSLAEMIREADREDQIAAARSLPRNPTIQLPDAPVEVAKSVNTSAAVPATADASTQANAGAVLTGAGAVFTGTLLAATVVFCVAPAPASAPGSGPVNAVPQPQQTVVAQNNTRPAAVEELPSFIPAPKSLVSEKAAAEVATVNPTGAANQNAVLTSLPKPTATSLDTRLGTGRTAQLMLLQGDDVMKVGEKRRYAVHLNSDVPLSLALLTLKFDPKVVKVSGLTAGNLLIGSPESTQRAFV